jgi:hypothetical protein
MTDTYKPQGGAAGRSTPGAAHLADQAKTLGKDLKTRASELTDTVTRVAKDQVDEIGNAAKDMAADATGRVKSAMTEQKTAGANYLGTVAQAVQRAAGEFDSDVPHAAHYIRQAAGQIESVANAVRERDMRELVGEVQEFARRQPTLFFGGAVILGFAALRFFKSSSPSGSALAKPSGTRTGGGSYSHTGAINLSSTRFY